MGQKEYSKKMKDYHRRYYLQNKEKILRKNKKWKIENKEMYKKSCAEHWKKYYKKNKERLKENRKKYHFNNKKEDNKKNKEWRLKYKDYLKEYNKKRDSERYGKKHLKEKEQENQRRKELGLPLIEDRKFYNETKLFIYISSLFQDAEIIRHNRSLLDGLELDIYIPSLKLAFEYQGYQHFIYPNRFHKTKEQFETLQWRDQRKQQLCEDNQIILIIIKCDEELSLQLVLSKLKENNIKFKSQTEIKQYIL